MTVQFLEQLWPLGCMSVSAAPEQMCQPKSMNFVRKMYVGTRIPSVEPHGLARGFSQGTKENYNNIRERIRKGLEYYGIDVRGKIKIDEKGRD